MRNILNAVFDTEGYIHILKELYKNILNVISANTIVIFFKIVLKNKR